jgi:hypothetical protein
MARIRTISHRTRSDFSSARVIVHTPIAPGMEQEGEASSSRIHLPYQDVHKFQHDGSNASKIPQEALEDIVRTGLRETTKVLWNSSVI